MAEEKVMVTEETPNNWSFRNYLKGVKRYKWWVLGATVAGVLIGFFSFKFLLNPAKQELSATYTYKLAAELEEGTTTTYRFIDGTLFDCFDITNKENLQAVKDSDSEKFKSVDVGKLYTSNAIKVEKVVTPTNQKDVTEFQLQISAKAKNFSNSEVGKEYLYALINYPKQISTNAIEKYEVDSYLEGDVQKQELVKQVSLLKKQYDTIDSTYKELQADFAQATVADKDGNTLYQIYNSFISKYNDGTVNTVDLLASEMYSKYYVIYEKGKEAQKIAELKALCEAYLKNRESYIKNMEVIKKQVDSLTNQLINSGDTEYTAEIIKLNDEIRQIGLSINEIEMQLNFFGYYEDPVTHEYEEDPSKGSVIKALTTKEAEWVAANDAFIKRVADTIPGLKAEKDKATEIYKYVYSMNRNKVTLTNAGYVALTGGYSNLIGIAVGLLGGYLISSIVVTGVYIYREDDKKKK